MKKLVVVVLALICALSMFGCGGGGTSTNTNTGTTGDTTTSGDEGLRVVIVTCPSGVDDGSFNQDNYEGAVAFVDANPGTVLDPIREQDVANAIPAVEAVVADYDVIITPGYQFAGIYEMAVDNPEKKFILVDSFPADADGNEVAADNIYAMQFAEQEAGFFAGISAALETKTGKVAVVNGIAYPSNVNYQFGFMSGVNYANKNLSANATIVELPSYASTDVTGADVGGNYIGDFSDEATGKVVGEALLAEGVDIIFVAAGASGNGVFTAVKEYNQANGAGSAYVIGCDVDQFDDGAYSGGNIVLTSATKVMSPNVTKQLNNIKAGTFAGGNYILTAETDSTGYISEAGRQQLSEQSLAELEAAYILVKDGTIVPAANFNGEGGALGDPTNFKGL
ncbi:MAG: BMP family ABC transporter substrate-binding protein [Coriobacteriales bacterium]|jgi:basic membrane protein A|nr:BMP family ABC transporter substrate-binding protein [Coriobacteriales bacterium]